MLDPLFSEQLNELLQQVWTLDRGGPFILSLYDGIVQTNESWCPRNRHCTGNLTLLEERSRSSLDSLPLEVWKDGWDFGTQALYFYGNAFLADLEKHFEMNRHQSRSNQDLFIKVFATNRNVSIYGVRRSLVQHIGQRSSMFSPGTKYHKSITFVPNIKESACHLHRKL